jgi:hypothetical protein
MGSDRGPSTSSSVASGDSATKGMIREQDGGYVLGPRGAAEFGRFGIEVDQLDRRTRPLLRPCRDWSERRFHLAGSLGAALTGPCSSEAGSPPGKPAASSP